MCSRSVFPVVPKGEVNNSKGSSEWNECFARAGLLFRIV
jgi:hypothetical protein